MGWKPRHRKDDNQADIVDALRAIGCRVYEIERPVDLLVEYRRRWLTIEVKNRDGFNRKTPAQDTFFEVTLAPAGVVHDVDEAIAFVTRHTL